MADEELEAVIRITIDDTAVEAQADAAVAKAKKRVRNKPIQLETELKDPKTGTRQKAIKVPVEPVLAPDAVEKAVKAKTKRIKVEVDPVANQSAITELKRRLELAQKSLPQARALLGDVGTPKESRGELRSLVTSMEKLVTDLQKDIAKREGRPGSSTAAPVEKSRIDETARAFAAATRAKPAAAAAPTETPPPIIVVTTPVAASAAVGRARGGGRGRPVYKGLQGLRQALNQLHTAPGGTPSLPDFDALVGRLEGVADKEYQRAETVVAREVRARDRAVPRRALARDIAREPSERTRRRRPLPPVREPDSVISGPTTYPFMEGNPRLGISPVYAEGEEPTATTQGFLGVRRSRRDPRRFSRNRGRIFTRDAADVLPGQVGPQNEARYQENRARMEAAARRAEAPVGEDTFNPVTERVRERAPRYSQAPIMAGQPFGSPSTPGAYGKRPGEPIPAPRGELGKLLRRFQAGQFEDYFQPGDETGKPTGPPIRATGTLATRIREDDPKYEQFRHEGRYFQRVAPANIAKIERERFIEETSAKTGIPALALVGAGPTGASRISRRKMGSGPGRRWESDEEMEARRQVKERARAETAGRVQEDIFRFNAYLGATRSGEGRAGPTGYLNVGKDVLPSAPEGISDADQAILERLRPELKVGASSTVADRQLRGGGAGMLYQQGRRLRSKRAGREARARIGATQRDVEVFDPTTAGLGGGGRTIRDTKANIDDSALSREVLEVINQRMAPILEGFKRGEQMTDVGPLGREGVDEPVFRSRQTARQGGSAEEIRTRTATTKLGPGQTAFHRFNQLLYDVTKSAGYSERAARSYQTGRLKIGAAKNLDVGVRTYLSSQQQLLGSEIRGSREAADALDPVQRDPRARGEQKRTFTPAYGELQGVQERLAEIGARRDKLSTAANPRFNKEGVRIGTPEEVAAAYAEDAELKEEQQRLRERRLQLRDEDEAQLAQHRGRAGGREQGARGGILGIAKRDRTRSRIARGRRFRAPGQEYMEQPGMQGPIYMREELVPGRGTEQFTEGRADTGDQYVAAAEGVRTGAATNLGATADRPAEEPIPRRKLKPKDRFKLQDTSGGTPAPPFRAAAGAPPMAPPPTDEAPPPPGDEGRRAGGGGGKGIIKVDIVKSIALRVIMEGAKAAAKGTVRRAAEAYEGSLGGEPEAAAAARATAKPPKFYDPFKLKMVGAIGPNVRLGTPSPALGFRPPALDIVDTVENKSRVGLRRQRLAEEREERLAAAAAGGGPAGPKPAPAITQARLLNQLRAEGIDITPTRPEPRPFTGKSPARISAEAEILEARALSPTRAFQTAVAGAFAKTIGGGGAFEKRVKGLTGALNARADAAEELSDTARELRAVRANLTEAGNKARDLADAGETIPATLVQYEESLQADRKRLIERGAAQRGERDTAQADVNQRRGGLLSAGGVVRGFAALGAGAIAGGLIFSAASQGIQAAIGLLEQQAAIAADALSGFALTANKVTAEMASAVRAAGGNVRGGVAGALAPSGITMAGFEAVGRGGLFGRAEAQAAAQARVQESDAFRTASGLGGRNFDAALFQGTGGVLGGQLLAPQPGFLERITGDLGALNQAMAPAAPNPNIPAPPSPMVFPGSQQRGPITPGASAEPQMVYPGSQQRGVAAPAVKTAEESARDLKLFNDYITDLNGQLKKVNSGFEFLSGATVDQKNAMIKSAEAIGRGDEARALALQNVAITGLGGEELRGTQFGTAVEEAARGQNAVSPEVAFELDKRAIEAAVAQTERDFQRELGTIQPQEAALQALAEPAIAPGSTFSVSNDKRGDEAERIEAATAETVGLQGQLNDYYEKGKAILKETLPEELYNRIESTGQAIVAVQAQIARASAALQTKEYNNQLRIALRTLNDIRAIQGKRVQGEYDGLGAINRQNVMLQRQSELLGQQLQQRQINFQLAVAGFIVPGQSPEERAARMKDAETQASFAQKQLDIQKKLYGNQIKVFDIENARAFVDTVASIGLLREGRQVAIDTALAEEKLRRLNKLQERNVKEAGAYLSRVEKQTAIAQSELQKLEAAYGKALTGIGEKTITEFIKNITRMYRVLSGSGDLRSNDQIAAGGGADRHHAAGALFNTTGTTSMIVGEAGTETVAVLRNPRTATLSGGGGGGGGVTININNPVVREDGDIQKITRSVIEAINTRTALLGLR